MSERGFPHARSLCWTTRSCVSTMLILSYLAMSVTAEITETYKPPSGVDAHFYEPFQDSDWTERWIHSSLEKYCGNFVVEHPPFDFIRQGDHALVAKDGGCHHAISHQLMDPFEIVNGTLVLQFEVLLQQKVECGGAYIKLMAEDENFHAENFDNRSPYLIMFGPDRCGTDGQVLFIFRHRHPITGVWSEKRMVNPPKIKGDLKPHIYTLHLKGNNSFDIFIDQERIRSGSLLLDFSPSVNPPREVADPTDVMPTDLRHNPIIPDLSVTKPDDWDENAPHEIPDPTAQKPDDWDESIPLLISDPSASRPVGWSTILQGPWTPPFILNPLCPTRRCGPWMPPMVANPAYKGKWSHPLIENPAYVGEWQPRLIPNPDYVEDLNPSQFLPIGSIGIEIWTTTPGSQYAFTRTTQSNRSVS
eukprot:TRINITY_DN2064_c0_g1_i1.p1 TRINITY_DN2064_c0_g1~~TRINITY_DN2064_c0_g1_i1.p1  ORF type:complete len:417 (+),score=97.41 TRINITY_DN2064_c0_g1_i1:47-1297(+)